MTTVATLASTVPGPADVEDRNGLALCGQLLLDLSALGIDTETPDFGERFIRFAVDNEPYTFELSPAGDLIVMAPTGWDSNIGENETNAALTNWRANHYGHASSQTVAYRLPSGAIYIPDAAWINQARYDDLRSSQYTSIIPGAPDFVVEVRSRADNVADGLAKMQEWMDAGAQLGWYIDPYEHRVHIFRSGQRNEVVDDPESLSGEGVLRDFVFEIRRQVFSRYAQFRNDGD